MHDRLYSIVDTNCALSKVSAAWVGIPITGSLWNWFSSSKGLYQFFDGKDNQMFAGPKLGQISIQSANTIKRDDVMVTMARKENEIILTFTEIHRAVIEWQKPNGEVESFIVDKDNPEIHLPADLF
jgi:hypothetical protein